MLGIFLVLVLGCSEPEIIIPPLEIPTSGQNVMVEELTGVRCPNCPSAAARLESIKLLYGENIVVVNVHGDLLTRPLPESKYDFRNKFASALEERFKPFIGKPSVVINRTIHPQFELLANPLQDQWQSIIEKELQKEQRLSILASILSDEESLSISVGIASLIPVDGPFYWHAYINENNLIDAQEDVDRIIPDYEHDHVLRFIATPEDGKIIDSQLPVGELFNDELIIEWSELDDSWVRRNLEVVLFVSDEEGRVVQSIVQKLD
jgi:hypothetical protein